VATEIERKFLVAGDGWRRQTSGPGAPIRQGYLTRPPATEVRVRRIGDRGALTIKGGRGMVRSEYEWTIDADEADQLLERALPAVISKTRFLVPAGELTWEVDEYSGTLAGLVVAEVELDKPDRTVDLPPWIGRELTGDDRYSNAALSARGLPASGPPVYVASPLGFTEPGRHYAERAVLPALRAAGLEPLDPWDDQDLRIARAGEIADAMGRKDALAAANDAVAARNVELIRSSAAVLAVLDGTDVDSGTAAEIGFAAALGIPITGLRTDIRPGGDNEAATVNLQVEWFIRQGGGRIHRSLDVAVAELAGLVGAVSS
jgi:adenylate cyclase